MGRLDPYIDITGKLNPFEVNAENINNIVDELNRNSDQLDSVQNNLAIVSRGSTLITASGGFSDISVNINHGLGFPPAVLAFYTLSTSSTVVHQLPNFVLDGSGNYLYSVTFTTTTNNLQFQVLGTVPAVTFNFSYYLLKQPANLSVISL